MTTLNYTPPPSLKDFLVSDKFVNLVVGPVGSTKTTASLIKIAYEASQVAKCHDGVRRSRCCVIRNTREQLSDTTIPDFLKFFPDGVAGTFIKTERKFMLRFDDVECEVMFRGLDDAADVRRLLSLQLTFGYMDEFREISMEIFDALQGRLGRYPDKSMNGVGACNDMGVQVDKVWAASNPPDYGSLWETYLSDPPKNAAVFFQPSGMSPEADWLQFLKPDFYENLAEGKSEAYIDVYIHAKFGKSMSGQPVFKAFNRDLHVAPTTLKPVLASTNPLIIGMDAGLNPAAVIGQMGYDGRVQIFSSLASNNMGALRFAREVLKPHLATRFPGMKHIAVIDPTAFNRSQTDERTVKDILNSEGIQVQAAMTNNIAARIAAVDNYLTRLVDGKPALVVDPSAELLVKALAGMYRYKINTKGDVDDSPNKDHPWSDLADALEYLCMFIDNGQSFGGKVLTMRREVKPAPYRWAV